MSDQPPAVTGIAPFFIVADMETTLDFYAHSLGFDEMFRQPAHAPFFAIVRRGSAMIFLKTVEASPLPNPVRDAQARWDAFVSVPDPDALADEFADRDVEFTAPLANTSDKLRGFEIADPDGHVLFFGRPMAPSDADAP